MPQHFGYPKHDGIIDKAMEDLDHFNAVLDQLARDTGLDIDRLKYWAARFALGRYKDDKLPYFSHKGNPDTLDPPAWLRPWGLSI